jgi:hypothetical protein
MSSYSGLIERRSRGRRAQAMLLARTAGEQIVSAFTAAMQHLLCAMHESNRRKAEQILQRYGELIEHCPPGSGAEQ